MDLSKCDIKRNWFAFPVIDVGGRKNEHLTIEEADFFRIWAKNVLTGESVRYSKLSDLLMFISLSNASNKQLRILSTILFLIFKS